MAAGCEDLIELDWWKCVQYRMKILVPDTTSTAGASTAAAGAAATAAASGGGSGGEAEPAALSTAVALLTSSSSVTASSYQHHPGFKVVGDKKVNKRKFDCNRLDWGWSEFATLAQAAETFVANNSITVAAEIELLDYDVGVKPSLGFVYKCVRASAHALARACASA